MYHWDTRRVISNYLSRLTTYVVGLLLGTGMHFISVWKVSVGEGAELLH